jgi:hypothetical protein
MCSSIKCGRRLLELLEPDAELEQVCAKLTGSACAPARARWREICQQASLLGLAQEVLMMGLGHLLRERGVGHHASAPFTASLVRGPWCAYFGVHQRELLLTVYLAGGRSTSVK